MSNVSNTPSVTALNPPVVSARVLGSAVGVLAMVLLLAYLVAFDQGAVSQSGMYLHELMHDGRHLLGVPCH